MGMISEIDILSEKMRFLGEFRYDLYGFYAWLKHRRYKFF